MCRLRPFLLVPTLAVVLIPALPAFSTTSYRDAVRSGTLDAFEAFLRDHPDSLRAEAAHEELWTLVQGADTAEGYARFVRIAPEARQVVDAMFGLWSRLTWEEIGLFRELLDVMGPVGTRRTDDRIWQAIDGSEDLAGHLKYVAGFPAPVRGDVAEKNAWTLVEQTGEYEAYLAFQAVSDNPEYEDRIERGAWSATMLAGTIPAYQRFQSDFPGTRSADAAVDVIATLENHAYEQTLSPSEKREKWASEAWDRCEDEQTFDCLYYFHDKYADLPNGSEALARIQEAVTAGLGEDVDWLELSVGQQRMFRKSKALLVEVGKTCGDARTSRDATACQALGVEHGFVTEWIEFSIGLSHDRRAYRDVDETSRAAAWELLEKAESTYLGSSTAMSMGEYYLGKARAAIGR